MTDRSNDTIDPVVEAPLVSRRNAIGQGSRTALMASLALGGVPLALAALSRNAFAQAADIRSVLDFAFVLENLEAEFYKAVLGESASATQNAAFVPVRTAILALPNAAEVTGTFHQIKKHEVAHVEFLRAALTPLGGPTRSWVAADFDFTGGNGSGTGPFAAATTSVDFLLAAAQGFEDTGVRAYKGQAANLMSDNNVLEAALRIHSVEARHAARVRRIRRARGATEVVRWSGTIRGGGAAAAGVTGVSQAVTDAFGLIYGGATPESNTQQGTVNVSNLSGTQGGINAATEAFDEPLTRAEVVAIVDPFIIPAIS